MSDAALAEFQELLRTMRARVDACMDLASGSTYCPADAQRLRAKQTTWAHAADLLAATIERARC